MQELMDVTTWQQHTVHSTLSTLGKKRGYKIVSSKDDGKGKERVYKIEGEANKTDE